MTFGDAKQFCYDHEMNLPTPRNDEENGWFTEHGPTWLDIYVNDLFSTYFMTLLYSFILKICRM